jgi:hypothetical protein
MVYAVAAETLQRVETALGRRVHWRRDARAPGAAHSFVPGDILRLNLFPHAMEEANAFYSPEAHGILFGYFRASTTDPGRNLPGQRIFTCLSHDVIAHEMTHAIIDGIRSYFTEPTNVDVAAFHEGFADLVALFRHFSHKEVLLDTLQKTGGRLFQFQLAPEAAGRSRDPNIQAQQAAQNPLIQLAQQFGEASGMRGGLRRALSEPINTADYRNKTEPHDRGGILVAAVFDAYFTIYTRRTADLFRIFRAGGGSPDPDDLPGSLAGRFAAEASRTASEFFLICVRALAYGPPVDITFGDFLRAVITAGRDLQPADPDGVRDAFMQAFRLRGIVADSAPFFSEDALAWPALPPGTLPPVKGLVFGDPNGLTLEEKRINGNILRTYARVNATKLGFEPASGSIDAPSFHPIFRVDSRGGLRIDMVVELIQTRQVAFDAGTLELGAFPARGGVTLLISQQPLNRDGVRTDPEIRHIIPKLLTDQRLRRQRAYYSARGLADGQITKKYEFESNGSPRQSYTMGHAPLSILEGYPMVAAEDGPYERIHDLRSGDQNERVFQVDDAGNGSATITFGDGVHGKIPVGTIAVTVRYGDVNRFRINFALIHGGI